MKMKTLLVLVFGMIAFVIQITVGMKANAFPFSFMRKGHDGQAHYERGDQAFYEFYIPYSGGMTAFRFERVSGEFNERHTTVRFKHDDSDDTGDNFYTPYFLTQRYHLRVNGNVIKHRVVNRPLENMVPLLWKAEFSGHYAITNSGKVFKYFGQFGDIVIRNRPVWNGEAFESVDGIAFFSFTRWEPYTQKRSFYKIPWPIPKDSVNVWPKPHNDLGEAVASNSDGATSVLMYDLVECYNAPVP